VKLVFAYECYADRDVLRFLRETVKRPLEDSHKFGQGAVVNALLVKKTVRVGMVDEDPRSSHHRLRDDMAVLRTTADFELRESDGRYLAILKPELEAAFLRSITLLRIKTSLPDDSSTLRRVLQERNSSLHDVFIRTLRQLYAEARERGKSIFLTDLVAMLEKVPRE